MSDEVKYWKRKEKDSDLNNPWTKVPNSVNVEMTAYALLAYIRRGLIDDAIPVMNWLISQQNDQGGFASTQVQCTGLFSSIILFLFALARSSSLNSKLLSFLELRNSKKFDHLDPEITAEYVLHHFDLSRKRKL